ncbi:OTU domain-containing protein 7B-like [Lycorma delicatula]|uniref:OTU domain-containing protein 7B-like n=1 Tax=Lycorma delicatula TaxID=130591 RepID=UPI003F511BDD
MVGGSWLEEGNAMWGFHDRLLTLRKALHAFLSSSPRREALWRRWRRQQSLLNAQAGLVYTEVEWSDHSGDVSGGDIYESLEEIHVLALAHVLGRPIIVIADTVLKDMNGEALAPIPFGGIYLPLECSASECHRSPLLLAYDGGHFSALVAMETQAPVSLASAIPLTDSNHELLPIQFSVDPEDREDFGGKMELSYSESIALLKENLDVVRIEEQEGESRNGILGSIGKSVGQKLRLKLSRSNSQRQNNKGGLLCAVLHSEKSHEYLDKMLNNYLHTARIRFQQEQEKPLE